jgi:hypothetical protein
MNGTATENWQETNQRYLMLALSRVRQALERKTGRSLSGKEGEIPPEVLQGHSADDCSIPSALEQLCNIFELSAFEEDLLLLCVGRELDASFPSLCSVAQDDPQQTYPTFGLALSILRTPHWSALLPSAPLRRWRLIEVERGGVLTHSPLRIDERILHYLVGVQYLDERLAGLVEPVRESSHLVKSHQHLAKQLADTLSFTAGSSRLPVVQLCGDDITSKRAIAKATCQMLGLNLHLLSADSLPRSINDLNQLLQLWEREALLSNSALLLDCDEVELSDRNTGAIARTIEQISSPLIVTTRERLREQQRPRINFDVRKPTSLEQRHLWQEALGTLSDRLNGHVETLVSQFNLSGPAIQAICDSTVGQIGLEENAKILGTALWNACRAQARPRMEDLAQRIEVKATWNDLVLPDAQFQTLQAIVAHVRQRAKVYESWGFANKGDRGLGISALFSGASGTGKTTAAEVLAAELQLDLYRIDLSSVVSKYIGETEKNLRRVFDAAETGGAILLFDEADALFGKRSEVKDSHDRHANIEVSYLLQRMEAYQGLAILTTNLKGSLDSAFLRRIRFVVQFSFPDATQRAEIWRRIFPKETPTEGLDMSKLAKLSVAGGNIRNIALNAAFLAANANEPVSMKHLLNAARSESAKLERPLIDSEVKGWIG